ncbi:MAG: hypothetical protein HQ562_03445 [Candidatus Marinimicrobia bacterium]|nr:hypothetical protein [Candidatus Neomarinimicrobiota bacterium]
MQKTENIYTMGIKIYSFVKAFLWKEVRIKDQDIIEEENEYFYNVKNGCNQCLYGNSNPIR